MRNKLLVIAVAIATTTVMLPSATANHLSVGAFDTLGTGDDPGSSLETRADPSVVGTVEGADDTPYGVGTKTDCNEPSAEITAEEIQNALFARGFCGELYYNHDSQRYAQASPIDQEIPGGDANPIGAFDVQRTWYVGPLLVGASGCAPMCDSTGQDLLWDAFHNAGSTIGITDGPEDADGGQEGRTQSRFVATDHTHPMGPVQRNTGIWEMNGWTTMAPVGESFVGYLTDNGGDLITEDDLVTLLNGMKGNQLSSETTPQICGYTPDRNFQGTGTQSFCELPFIFVPADDSVGDIQSGNFTSYENECDSPTYVCASTSGSYWRGESTGLVGAYAGRYQGDQTRWHFVVGPNKPDCPNTEPGFDFDADGNDWPYLAHDLDVFVPPHAISGAPHTVSTAEPQRYADEVAANLFPLPSLGPGDEAVAAAETAIGPVTQSEAQEPNNGDPISGIPDNSRSISIDRGLGDECSQLATDEELADPWVNIIDNTVDANRHVHYRDPVVDTRTPPELATDSDHIGLHGSDESQDASNDPTTGLYTTDGHIGMFTDKDDDGQYERVTGPDDSASTFGAGVYGQKNIGATGAYPMLWDMHASLDDTGTPVIEAEEGCGFTGDKTITETMVAAGYGVNTGIAQAIYLKEPTVFVDQEGTETETVPYPGGNNIYLLLNDAARGLWDGSVSSSNGLALDARVDDLVADLRAHVVANYDVPGEPAVEQPGAELGLESDFQGQCGESTGGYDLDLSFLHNCDVDCSGDTIATMYTFEVDAPPIGGGDIPSLVIDGVDHPFTAHTQTWYDVDPFDGDASRNNQQMAPPPS